MGIDKDNEVYIETMGIERIWRVYSGQLQGTSIGAAQVEQAVQVTCATSGGFAAFFWLWAVHNILFKGKPDLGVLTFATVLACHYAGWQSTQQGGVNAAWALKKAERYRLAGWAHGLVALNYFLGFFATASLGFRTYCFAFGILWAVTAMYTRNLSERWCGIVGDRVGAADGGGGGSGGGSGGSPSPLGGLAGWTPVAQSEPALGGFGDLAPPASSKATVAGFELGGDGDDDDDEAFIAEL